MNLTRHERPSQEKRLSQDRCSGDADKRQNRHPRTANVVLYGFRSYRETQFNVALRHHVQLNGIADWLFVDGTWHFVNLRRKIKGHFSEQIGLRTNSSKRAFHGPVNCSRSGTTAMWTARPSGQTCPSSESPIAAAFSVVPVTTTSRTSFS